MASLLKHMTPNQRKEYEVRKEDFVSVCKSFVKINNMQHVWPCSIEEIAKVKQLLTQDFDSVKTLTEVEYYIRANFALKKQNVIHQNSGLCIVTAAECFDVIVQAHALNYTTNDGDVNTTFKAISSVNKHIFVPKFVVTIFYTLCNSRKSGRKFADALEDARELALFIKKNSSNKNLDILFNHHVYVSIVPMPMTDNGYQYVLVYIDFYSRYTLLRPMQTISPVEIAVELFKIFADFGMPIVISCIENTKEIFKKALSILETNFNTNKINMLVKKHCLQFGLIKELEVWMKLVRHNDWTMGCYIVQQQINNRIPGFNRDTPYMKVFSKKDSKKNENVPRNMESEYPKMDVEEEILNVQTKDATKTSGTLTDFEKHYLNFVEKKDHLKEMRERLQTHRHGVYFKRNEPKYEVIYDDQIEIKEEPIENSFNRSDMNNMNIEMNTQPNTPFRFYCEETNTKDEHFDPQTSTSTTNAGHGSPPRASHKDVMDLTEEDETKMESDIKEIEFDEVKTANIPAKPVLNLKEVKICCHCRVIITTHNNITICSQCKKTAHRTCSHRSSRNRIMCLSCALHFQDVKLMVKTKKVMVRS